MPGIPPGLKIRLQSVLLRCGPFASDAILHANFSDGRISDWEAGLPSATNKADRIDLTISYLWKAYNIKGENVLALFLDVLIDKTPPANACHTDLMQLAQDVRKVRPPLPPPPPPQPGKTKYILLAVAILLVIAGIVALLTRPRLTIESHRDGDIVERAASISGTYRNLGEGWMLWSLVYPEDSFYWVQSYIDPEHSKGEWVSYARFGVADTRDIGDTFEFIILAVRERSDAEKVLRTAYNREQNYIDELPTQVRAKTSITVERGSPVAYWLADFWASDDRTAKPITTTHITSRYVFQEWWQAPFEGLPEEGWTARFARRVNVPQDGEYCFHRVRDDPVVITLDGVELAFEPETDDNLEVGSVCQDLQAGLHEVHVDLHNVSGERTWAELWYDGPGLSVPTGPLTETWQATFYPRLDLSETPVLRTSLTGDALAFSGVLTGGVPVVNFAAVFSRVLTLADGGWYRFDVHVDDGARLAIDGDEVLDEWHGGPGSFLVDRYLEAGDHTLQLVYFEYSYAQFAEFTWQRTSDPVRPNPRILFVSDRDWRGDEIYIADADGSDPRLLTRNDYPDRDPAWSPDGQRIVFAADPEEDNIWDLYIMTADGGNPQLLIGGGGQPRWSPDGARIVFTRWISETAQYLFLVNTDGSGVHALSEGQVIDYNPDWSPDGSQIIFERHQNEDAEIYVINANGSDPRNISNSPDTWDSTPAWSPDGQEIAFSSRREENTDIYIMKVDGSDVRRVTEWEMDDTFPDWSPDGRFLVFQGGDAGWRQIYKIDPTSDADRIALTDCMGSHEKPQWTPPGHGYTITNFTDGDAVNPGSIAITQDSIWTGGAGGLLRWNRSDPTDQRKYTAEDIRVGNDIRRILPMDAETLWLSVGQWPFYEEGWGQLKLGETEQWRTFTPGDSLDAEQVFDLYKDAQGRIWAGTSNGLWMYEDEKWQSWLPSQNWISEITQASDGALWLDSPSRDVLRYVPTVPGDETYEAFDLMTLLESENAGYQFVSAIVEGAPGELWFVTNAGVALYDGESWRVPDDRLRVWISDILWEDDGTLWFGADGWPTWLIRRDPNGELRFYTEDDGLTGNVTALALDDDGVLWAAGDGLNHYDRESDRWTGYWADEQRRNLAGTIFQDSQGVLWFGHGIFHRGYIWRQGVSRYAPGTDDVWTYFDQGAIHTIQQDHKGLLWFGTDIAGDGACPYDPETEQWYTCATTATSELQSNNVDSILSPRDGALWFGTSGGGLTRAYEGFWQTFRAEGSPLLSDDVHCLVQDSEDGLWISTDRGVNRLFYESRLWASYNTDDGLADDEVLAMALDGEDSIWFGTHEGLSHYNYTTGDFTTITDGPRIADWVSNCQQLLLVDRYGSLWVGTDEGLYRRTPEGGWIHLTTANGLASNRILALYEDVDGAIWVGTPYGISRIW